MTGGPLACLICKDPKEESWLCPACYQKLKPCWEVEDVAVYCPKCGFRPMEDSVFESLYPGYKSRAKPGSMILLVYNEAGCTHFCSRSPGQSKARISEIWFKPPESPA